MKDKLLFLLILLFSCLVISAQAQTVEVAKEGIGIEGIKVGKSTRSDVIRKFGRDFETKKYGKYSYQMIYESGLSFYFCQADKQQEIFVIEMRAPYLAKTSKGIELSKSTVGDIQRVYGKAKKGLRYRGVEFYYATVRDKKVVTVIDIIERKGMRECKENK